MLTDDRLFIYRIDAEDRITLVNREWLDFARENAAPELVPEHLLGEPLERFIADWPTRHLYEIVYQRVRQAGRKVRLPFRCDSPDRRRAFQMTIAPLEQGGLEFTVRVVGIEPSPKRPVLDRSVKHSTEVAVICSWCKRLRVGADRWAEIEEAVAEEELFGADPPSLTHDVCPACLATIRDQLEAR
ncbi:MAG: hypothetical protein IH614_15575 [Desulfuromonadales bacterium]|nr:hypothetical protein [Desulfuromonadales bacterium]